MTQRSGNLAKYESKNPVKRYFVQQFLENIKTVIGQSGAKKIIDVGCGEGQTIKYLNKNIGKLQFVGVDISKDAIKIARDENPRVKFSVGDIAQINDLIAGERFDLVICIEVLEHLGDPGNALEILGKLNCKKFLFSVPSEPWFSLGNLLMLKNISRLGSDEDHKHKWTRGEFAGLVEKYFTIEKVETAGFWTIAIGRKF